MVRVKLLSPWASATLKLNVALPTFSTVPAALRSMTLAVGSSTCPLTMTVAVVSVLPSAGVRVRKRGGKVSIVTWLLIRFDRCPKTSLAWALKRFGPSGKRVGGMYRASRFARLKRLPIALPFKVASRGKA